MYDSNSTCIILYLYSNYYNNIIVIFPTHYVAYINTLASQVTRGRLKADRDHKRVHKISKIGINLRVSMIPLKNTTEVYTHTWSERH